MKFGLQLYTVEDECKKDFLGTIKKVADIGYKGLEFAGYYNIKPKEIKKVIDDFRFDEGTEDQQGDLSRLEEKSGKVIQCPHCGEKFEA